MTVLNFVQSPDNISEKQARAHEDFENALFLEFHSALCLSVPAGCHSVSGCCSGFPWPFSCCDKTHSRDYRKIQMWGQQTPDPQGCWV